MAHKFNEKLKLPSQQGGPVARGSVAAGEKMEWIAVWITQNVGGNAAAARGGADWTDKPQKGKWKTETELVTGSDHFLTGQPAMATAIALVKKGNAKEFYWWGHAVEIVA
jgi:hypothetical protein